MVKKLKQFNLKIYKQLWMEIIIIHSIAKKY